MHPKLTITIITLLICWATNSYAQYIPKNQRKTHMKLHNIKIKEGEQAFIRRSVVYCDTLIMEDKSTLKIPHKLKSFTLYAKYCKIGKQCTILSRGKSGAKPALHLAPFTGESGTNAPRLNLYLNIYAMGDLIIDARGGNGGTGTRPGICGSGGNVALHYFSPQPIDVLRDQNYSSKNRRTRYTKPTIKVANRKGKMFFRRTRRFGDANTIGNFGRSPLTSNQTHIPHNIAPERHERKDGQLKINRQRNFIPPMATKIK